MELLKSILPELDTSTNLVINLKFMQYTGFWPPVTFTGWRLGIYFCYTTLAYIFILGIYITTQSMDLYHVWGNIPLMTADAFLLFTNLAQTIKLFNVIIKRQTVYEMFTTLEKITPTERSPELEAIIKRYAWYGMRDFLIYSGVTFIGVSLWALSPVLAHEPGTHLTLPLNAWYPYDKEASPAYELTYTQQVLAIVLAASLNVTIDTLAINFMNQTACQFELLKYNLAHTTDANINMNNTNNKQDRTKTSVIRRNVDRKGISGNENEVSAVDITDELSRHNMVEFDRLKKCIIHHQIVLNLVEKIEYTFSFSTLSQFFVSLIIICVSAFQLAVQSNIIEIFGIGVYLLDMMFQVFLYCWYGNEVMYQSKEVLISAYDCIWYNSSQKFKSSLKTLMLRSLRPVKLTAGGFTALSVETFVAIIKISYSFFTILQQMNEAPA